jgi:hypothetical protein
MVDITETMATTALTMVGGKTMIAVGMARIADTIRTTKLG